MKSLKKTRRKQIIGIAILCMVVSFTAFYLAAPNALQFFRTPTEVAEVAPPATEVFRLGGLVEEGSLVKGEGEQITFRVTDTNASILVTFEGIPPPLFGEGEGTVVTGSLVEGVFVATELLARHDETYMPKEVVDALKEQGVYREPES
jgi:cytochrome c-type biogenesis protein CcmE